MGIALVVVRDNELDVGDDEAASSDIAEGGTAREGQGKSRGWAREQLDDGRHNDPRGGTEPDFRGLGIIGLRGYSEFKEPLSIEANITKLGLSLKTL